MQFFLFRSIVLTSNKEPPTIYPIPTAGTERRAGPHTQRRARVQERRAQGTLRWYGSAEPTERHTPWPQ